MADHATPNLPSRDFSASADFYGKLGFEQGWRDDGWMILERGGLMLEFFPYLDLDPWSSSFSCCLRVDDLDGLYQQCLAAGVPIKTTGFPRVHPPKREASGITIAYLLDPDGTLVRLIQN